MMHNNDNVHDDDDDACDAVNVARPARLSDLQGSAHQHHGQGGQLAQQRGEGAARAPLCWLQQCHCGQSASAVMESELVVNV